MPEPICFGKGGLLRCISWSIHRSKPTREKYPNRPKTHNLENLVLIAEDEKKTRRNSGVSNVYTFLHADFEGVGFYAATRYVHFTKEGREEYLFVSDEDEEDDGVLLVLELPLFAEQRVCSVGISYFPCLASRHNSKLTSKDMNDFRCQGIFVNDNNNPAPPKKTAPQNTPLTQLEEEKHWIYEIIICLRRPKHLHITNADLNNYSCEEATKMTKLELFLILFHVDHQKDILITETNNILKHPIDPVEFI